MKTSFKIALFLSFILAILLVRYVGSTRKVDSSYRNSYSVEKYKNNTKGKLTNKSYVLAGGEVLNYTKPDFISNAFQKIKDLCKRIKSLRFEYTISYIRIIFNTMDGQEFSFEKKLITDSQINFNANLETMHYVDINRLDQPENCNELLKIIGFMEWDYENTNLNYPEHGIPDFISQSLREYRIEQSIPQIPALIN